MLNSILAICRAVFLILGGHKQVALENIALRQQLGIPTARFRVLFVFIVLSHERRRVVHFNITEHPTAEWAAQQIIEAFPDDLAPRYLIRDRDGIYGRLRPIWYDGLWKSLPKGSATRRSRLENRVERRISGYRYGERQS